MRVDPWYLPQQVRGISTEASVGSPDAVSSYINELLREKRNLMGMGHLEYRTVDPRALILKPMAIELCEGTNNKALCNTLAAIDDQFSVQMANRAKDIHANVELYKGAMFLALVMPALHGSAGTLPGGEDGKPFDSVTGDVLSSFARLVPPLRSRLKSPRCPFVLVEL